MRKIVLLFATLLPLSCSLIVGDVLTSEQANAVELGMTMAEVKEICGPPTNVAHKPGFTAHHYWGLGALALSLKYVDGRVAETSYGFKDEWFR